MAASSGARARQDLQSAYHVVAYTSLGADKDLVADSPDKKSYCRRIKVLTAGTLVVTLPDGTNCTMTDLVVGETEDIQVAAIVASGTTVTKCRVYY